MRIFLVFNVIFWCVNQSVTFGGTPFFWDDFEGEDELILPQAEATGRWHLGDSIDETAMIESGNMVLQPRAIAR